MGTLLIFAGGVIAGSIVTFVIFKRQEIYGEIKLDPRDDTCQVLMSTEHLIRPNTKRVIFTVDRHADLSQK